MVEKDEKNVIRRSGRYPWPPTDLSQDEIDLLKELESKDGDSQED